MWLSYKTKWPRRRRHSRHGRVRLAHTRAMFSQHPINWDDGLLIPALLVRVLFGETMGLAPFLSPEPATKALEVLRHNNSELGCTADDLQIELECFSEEKKGHRIFVRDIPTVAGSSTTATRFHCRGWVGRPKHRVRGRLSSQVYFKTPASIVQIGRPLVFDLDSGDLDRLRVCCRGAAICSRCLGIMLEHAAVIDDVVHYVFNLSPGVWQFSGKKGLHGWFLGQSAILAQRYMSEGIVRFLSSYRLACSEHYITGVLSGPMGSSLVATGERLVRVYPFFAAWQSGEIPKFPTNGPLSSIMPPCEPCDFADWTLALAHHTDVVRRIKQEWKPVQFKWLLVCLALPRLDALVTTQSKHALSLPNGIHPDTRRVALVLPRETLTFAYGAGILGLPTADEAMRDIRTAVMWLVERARDEKGKKSGVPASCGDMDTSTDVSVPPVLTHLRTTAQWIAHHTDELVATVLRIWTGQPKYKRAVSFGEWFWAWKPLYEQLAPTIQSDVMMLRTTS